MFASPIFDPTKLPPPLPLVPFPTDQLETQRILDEGFVAEFLTSKNRGKTSKVNKPRITIHDYRALISNAFANMHELKQLKTDLEQHKEMHPEGQWTELLARAQHVQDLLLLNLQDLEDPPTALAFRSSLASRRKKRMWLKRRNKRLAEQRTETLASRERLHLSIESWQEQMKMKVEEEKRLQLELENAARFLADVHRRKAEAKRNLARFERLRQLHHNRQERQQAGGEPSEEKFVADLREPIRKWTETLAGCVSEERRLKDVLARRSIVNRKRRVENQWQKVFFGDAVGLKTTFKDMDRLVEVRRAWDKYLVLSDKPDGSSVPFGWVLPSDVPLHGWVRYREQQQEATGAGQINCTILRDISL